MNIEDLTKTQLLLLTILVNFVTSIGTGVLTVSLLDQAPPTVIQTVNRIVDHTIETVATEVPVIRGGSSGPTTEELLTTAIAELSARTVKINRTGSDNQIGIGVYVPSSRSVFTTDGLPGTVAIAFSDGTVVTATDVASEVGVRRYTFAADAVLPSLPAARLVPSTELKQGQTVIALSSSGAAVTGIVTLLAEYVQTDLPGISAGTAAVNISGDIIGISLGEGRYFSGERLAGLVSQ
jgi:hypothetical protein